MHLGLHDQTHMLVYLQIVDVGWVDGFVWVVMMSGGLGAILPLLLPCGREASAGVYLYYRPWCYALSSYTQMNEKLCSLYLRNRLWHFVKLWIVLNRAGIMHSPPF